MNPESCVLDAVQAQGRTIDPTLKIFSKQDMSNR